MPVAWSRSRLLAVNARSPNRNLPKHPASNSSLSPAGSRSASAPQKTRPRRRTAKPTTATRLPTRERRDGTVRAPNRDFRPLQVLSLPAAWDPVPGADVGEDAWFIALLGRSMAMRQNLPLIAYPRLPPKPYAGSTLLLRSELHGAVFDRRRAARRVALAPPDDELIDLGHLVGLDDRRAPERNRC
jgi:hypothetical protein